MTWCPGDLYNYLLPLILIALNLGVVAALHNSLPQLSICHCIFSLHPLEFQYLLLFWKSHQVIDNSFWLIRTYIQDIYSCKPACEIFSKDVLFENFFTIQSERTSYIDFHITFYVRRCLPFGDKTKMSSSETFSRHALRVVSNTSCAYLFAFSGPYEAHAGHLSKGN